MDLGNVKQKATNMGWWVPRVHQLMVYVGTSRTGMGAKNAKRIKKQAVETKRSQEANKYGMHDARKAREVVQLPSMSRAPQ